MSWLEAVPTLDAELAQLIAHNYYGVRSHARLLPSERDQNFLLTTESGERFVLKIANGREQAVLLESQNQAMGHLAKRLSYCPQVVPTTSGEQITRIGTSPEDSHFVRLVTYLPGAPLGDLKEQSSELLCDIGEKLGRLDRELTTFDHAALHRDFHWDLVNGPCVVKNYGALIPDPSLRELVVNCAEELEATLAPRSQKLRRSIIHGDPNDYNVIIGPDDSGLQRVLGLIDFGDMVYSYTIGDLAVAIAYAVLGKSDPIESASWIVTGYAQECPLNEAEIEALFVLVRMRLCMSVCLAAYQQQQLPDNAYLDISQQAIRGTLPALVEIDSREVTKAFRQACHCF